MVRRETITTAIKCCVSLQGVAGFGMLLQGLGALPVDPDLAAIAGASVDCMNIPHQPFFVALGTFKITAVASQWGYGPLPQWLARLGLMTSCVCAAFGHQSTGQSTVPPFVMLSLVAALFALDAAELSDKTVDSMEYDYIKQE